MPNPVDQDRLGDTLKSAVVVNLADYKAQAERNQSAPVMPFLSKAQTLLGVVIVSFIVVVLIGAMLRATR